MGSVWLRGRSASGRSAGAPGPWGRLERTRFHLEQPEEFLRSSYCDTAPPRWILPGYTAERLRELLTSVDADASSLRETMASLRCDVTGCTAVPSAELGLRLSPESRGRLYREIGRFQENLAYAFPFSRPVNEDTWRDLGDIVDLSLIERVSWRQGNSLRFSDLHLLCRQARSDRDRLRIVEALARMGGVMAWINVDANTDLDAIERYWERGSRRRELRPMLEALARRPGGGQLDIIHLLPAFARRRLNTFSGPDDPPRDCYWSALNFFTHEQPPDVFVDGQGAEAALRRDYTQIPWEQRTLGDVILFVVPGSGPLHAANFVADDLVFTKNGNNARRPWALSPLSDVREIYPEATELRVYRLRTEVR